MKKHFKILANTQNKYDVEVAILNDSGTIIGWDEDAVWDYVEAVDAEEAMDFARDYLIKEAFDNGIHYVPYILRARKVINPSYGDFGEWVYE